MRENYHLKASGAEYKFDEGASLLDIFVGLRERWRTISGFTLCAFLVSLGAGFALPGQYESSVLISVGKTITLGQTTDQIERLGSLIYGLTKGGRDDQLSKKLQVPVQVIASVPEGTDLIRLAVRSPSQQKSDLALGLLVDDLKERHSATIDKTINAIKLETENARKAKIEMETLLKKLLESSHTESSLNSMEAFILRKELSEQSLKIDKHIHDLNLRILQTSETRTASSVMSPGGPVAPNVPLIIILGTLIGTFSGLLFALAQHFSINRRTASSNIGDEKSKTT
jgi:hypothetical protein